MPFDPRQRPLTPAEARVLATLLEKSRTVPDSYPLTLNSLAAGCNQKTSREPVMQLADDDLLQALTSLRQQSLVVEIGGARVARWEHNFARGIGVPDQSAVLLGLLMLRGPQTAAELRLNAGRWHRFADTSSVEAFLDELQERSDEKGGPLVMLLPKAPGAREPRWAQLLCGPVDVAALGVDFYCITGHKLYGPSGSGAIWIRAGRQAEMRPFMGGGDMIRTVSREGIDYADPPLRFEAGTPGIVNQIGLGAALEYLMAIGMAKIAAHERDLRDHARERLRSLNWLRVQGDAADKGAIFSMTMDGAHAHDISTILDKRGIAVRAGSHCAMPLMEFYGISASARASFAMYNTRADVDALVDGLSFCRELFA